MYHIPIITSKSREDYITKISYQRKILREWMPTICQTFYTRYYSLFLSLTLDILVRDANTPCPKCIWKWLEFKLGLSSSSFDRTRRFDWRAQNVIPIHNLLFTREQFFDCIGQHRIAFALRTKILIRVFVTLSLFVTIFRLSRRFALISR